MLTQVGVGGCASPGPPRPLAHTRKGYSRGRDTVHYRCISAELAGMHGTNERLALDNVTRMIEAYQTLILTMDTLP